MLEDGRYDVSVVDATELTAGVVQLSLTITAGEHKGAVVELDAEGLGRSEIDLLGLPGTLYVEGGAPRLDLES